MKAKICTLLLPLAGGISLSAAAAVVVVGPGDPVQAWTVDSSTELRVVAGGSTLGINATGTTVTVDNGGVVNGRLNLLGGSTGSLNGGIVNSGSDFGIHLQDASVLSLTDGQVDGQTRGVNAIGYSQLSLTGATVYGHGTGSGPTPVEGGLGLSMLGATAGVRNSTLTGDRYGVVLLSDARGTGVDYLNTLTLDNSTVEGKNDSAIFIGRALTRNSHTANVTIANGTVLTADNNTLVETTNGATSNITVDNSQLTGDIVTDGSVGTVSNLILQNAATLTGRLRSMGQVTLSSGTTWTVTGDSDVRTLTNGGDITFSSGAAGRTLTVYGDYSGNGGLITFNSVLGADESLTDRLAIGGDTSGNTNVRVNNLGGSGAQTLNGITLITVGGNSEGTFTQQGRIVAGSYEYALEKAGKDWRLCSGTGCGSTPPEPPVTPPEPPVTPPVITPGDLTLRPEAGSYMANGAAAENMFRLQRDDRYRQADPDSGLWLLMRGNRTSQNDATGQLNMKGNTWVTILGTDLLRSDDGHYNMGVMAGYGYNSNTTRSSRTSYSSKGSVNGYTTGLYAGWNEKRTDGGGLYVDSWLQYGMFTGRVNGEELTGEKYHLRGPSASFETGYHLPVWLGTESRITLTPKGQVVWSGIKTRDHTESNGTKVKGAQDNNVQTRLGARLDWSIQSGHGAQVTPYAEVVWLNNSSPYGVTMDDVVVSSSGTRNLAEFRVGGEGEVTPGLKVNGMLIQQQGENGYRDTGAQVGVSWRF